jgi:MIP family channel proteins
MASEDKIRRKQSELYMEKKGRTKMLWLQRAWAEFIGMFLFVFVSTASAINGGLKTGSAYYPGTAASYDVASVSGSALQVALTFGMSIFVLACVIGHHSGGQMNCAVTFALVIAGDVPIVQGVINVIAQTLGSIMAAFFCWAMFPIDKDLTKSLASNTISSGYSTGNAMVGEIFMTFLLCFVVFEVAVNPATKNYTAPLAIGMAVFMAHSVMINVDGCSINPTRSFGPAVVSSIRYSGMSDGEKLLYGTDPDDIWRDHWVFWVGPLTGAFFAALMARFWWHPGSWAHEEPDDSSVDMEQTKNPAANPEAVEVQGHVAAI